MQRSENVLTKTLCRTALAATFMFGYPAHSQTTPSGQVVAPASKTSASGGVGCNGAEGTSSVSNTSDANCVEGAPGFARPTLEPAAPDTPHSVTALVRVEAAMPRPPVVLPEGNSFTVIGSVTLIRVRRPDQAACLATGKRISGRVSAGTSTTCLDHKGELLAVEECKPGSPECTVLTAQEIARQQTAVTKP